MVKTIEEGFRLFHGRLTPTLTESDAAKRHRGSIEQCLKNSFQIDRFFRTGSFGNATSIRGSSDVDYFASVPIRNVLQNSRAMLGAVWSALNARFPYSGVRTKNPAIVVPFRSGIGISEATEIVPAVYLEENQYGFATYAIADGSAGWMRSSSESHNAYVAAVDENLANKVKPLVRFVKAWKFFNSVPIRSFYLELRVADYCSREESIVYYIDLNNILADMLSDGLAPVEDPLGISGIIEPCVGPARLQAMSKLRTAATRANKACEAELAGKTAVAFNWWRLVFAQNFPAYR